MMILKGTIVLIGTRPDQQLSDCQRNERADHVERKHSPALRRLGFRVQPALGCDEEASAAEPDHRTQDEPWQRSDEERHGRSRSDN
jgi:hypothetical protein